MQMTVKCKTQELIVSTTDCRSLRSITIDTIDECSSDQVLIDRDGELGIRQTQWNQLWRAPSIVSIEPIDSQLIDTINSSLKSGRSIRSTISWSTQSTLQSALKSPLRSCRSIRSTVTTQSTLALQTAYDKNIYLPYQINVVAFRKVRRYVALFCKGQRHQNNKTL